MKNKARILLLDLETMAAIAYTWGLWDVNIGINQIVQDGYVFCWCAKWLGSNEIMSDALINYKKAYKADPTNDKYIAESIWKLLDEADIVVTHNGDNFDIKWLNTLFIKHGLKPLSHFKSIDTLKESRKNFHLMSHKLDFISRKLDLGYKLHTGGFELWEQCSKGNKQAWKKMVHYCKNDVILLEKVYNKIRPYVKSHPNMALFNNDKQLCCPNCGDKNVHKKGYYYTLASVFQRYICFKCGKSFKSNEKIRKG